MAKSYRVLVADDDLDHVTIVRAILEQNGYEALEAFNGEETLEQVEKHHPDLLLLDIMMPKIDGLEVVRRLKENPATRNLPVIMFSAKSGTREIIESFNFGASNYLIKPIDTPKLLQKIKATLRKEEDRVALEKRYKSAQEPDPRKLPSRQERELREHRTQLANSVSQFLAATDLPLEVLHKELFQLGGMGSAERDVRAVAKKLEALSTLCAELRDFLAGLEETADSTEDSPPKAKSSAEGAP
ncbi:MAG: response regulator [Candidatus Wallbacteria bacterium]|nr:response regulator [Candidatus Wallbacteria bacterium]